MIMLWPVAHRLCVFQQQGRPEQHVNTAAGGWIKRHPGEEVWNPMNAWHRLASLGKIPSHHPISDWDSAVFFEPSNF